MVAGPDGKPVAVPAGVTPPQAPAAGRPGSQPDGNSEQQGEEGKGDKKQESPEPKVIRRGDLKAEDADPEELKATVGPDGKVAFQFRNQPWVELVQWLSEIADQPLDWQELPVDRVNLTSPGRYTVAETQDLFNRHLLARGFTILKLNGGLTISKTENIDPAMVPRVSVFDLGTLQPHTFVRATLDVGWLSAEKLAEELKAMIGPTGKLTAMTTTNRLEVVGPAINIRQVAELLDQERDSVSRESLAPEFKLRYLPAEEAKRMLEEFLGVEKKQAAPMTPQQMQMMQQMRQQNPQAVVPQKKVEISIVANVRQNSVIIRAPVDRIAVATEFLKRVDVPSQSLMSLSEIESRVQVFRLQTLDPEKLIEIIGEMNILEPTTRVRVDKDNDALIVSGSPADRFIINSLIERLDGEGREFHVLQLRRLDANDVAESIGFLMGQEKEEDDNRSSRRYYYYGGYGNEQEEKKDKDEFRVAANARFRQVLLWANDREMEQVQSLLVKLGELPPPGGSSRTIRMIDASATPETYEYLQRLRQQWNRVSPNPLEIPDASQFKDPIKDADAASDAETESETDDGEDTDRDGTESDQPKVKAAEPEQPRPKGNKSTADTIAPAEGKQEGYRLTLMQPPAGELQLEPPERPIRNSDDFDRMFRRGGLATSEADRPKSNPAVRIELDEAGNLILVSPDTAALDQLENLMLQFRPPRRPYQVFKMKYASSYWVRLNLEDYFEEDEENGNSSADSFYRWYWDLDDQTDKSPTGLGKGNKLRFVDDPDTNTIVVTGATDEQLRTIDELIELWDVDEPVNKRKMRFTRLVALKFGQADKISETIKDAYRDLLSSNDRAFSGGRGQNQNPGQGGTDKKDVPRNREGNGSTLTDGDNGNDGGGADFSFKGKLSIGVDKVGNTLLISAEGESLLDLVTDMIKQLDEASRPAGEVEVLQLSGDVSGESIRRALQAFGAKRPRISAKMGDFVRAPKSRNSIRRRLSLPDAVCLPAEFARLVRSTEA